MWLKLSIRKAVWLGTSHAKLVIHSRKATILRVLNLGLTREYVTHARMEMNGGLKQCR